LTLCPLKSSRSRTILHWLPSWSRKSLVTTSCLISWENPLNSLKRVSMVWLLSHLTLRRWWLPCLRTRYPKPGPNPTSQSSLSEPGLMTSKLVTSSSNCGPRRANPSFSTSRTSLTQLDSRPHSSRDSRVSLDPHPLTDSSSISSLLRRLKLKFPKSSGRVPSLLACT